MKHTSLKGFPPLYCFAALLLLLFGAGSFLVAPVLAAPNSGSAVRPLDRTQNILILGSDRRPGSTTWRTDAILFAAVDWDKGQVGILNIPRDLLVDLGGGRMDKIDNADYVGETQHYPGGGPALVSQVLTKTLGIRAQNYVRIKMPAVAQMIDGLGGITVTLASRYREQIWDDSSPTKYTNVDYPAGVNHFDGRNALLYMRGRLSTGELDRARRQQQVLMAVRQRFLELGWLQCLTQLWSAYQNTIETDLSWWDILRLGWFGARLDSSQIHGRYFSYEQLQVYVSKNGDWFLTVPDRKKVDGWVDGLFSAPPPGR